MRRTRMIFAFVLGSALAAGTAGGAPNAQKDAPAQAPSKAGDALEGSAMTSAELDRMLASLAEPDVEKRRAAALAIADLNRDATTAIAAKLTELRKTQSDGVYAVLKAARDANGGRLATEVPDVLDSMIRLPRSENANYGLALTSVCLLRALAHISTTPAVRQLISLSADHNNAFRGEITAIVKQLGEQSIAALIEAKLSHSSETRHWAFNLLEAMDKRLPGQAVQTKSNQVLADVLHAYGGIHDMDAVSVILSFVNSDRAQVRVAARDSLALYGQDAIWKLREAYTNLVGKSAPDTWGADQVAKELFAAYDRFRLQEVYALLDDGIAKQREGKLELAIASFDKVLARQPMLDRRAEMVGAYVGYAQSIEDADKGKALAIFRKAARLDPEGPRAGQIESEIAYLEGEQLLARGIADADTFRRALALDAANAKARAELDRLEANVEGRQERVRRWSAAGAILAVAIAGIVLFGGRRRKKPDEARI